MTTSTMDRSHRIIERETMAFRPFGVRPDGTTIRDVSGVVIRGNLEFLEEHVRNARGLEAGAQAVRDLIRLLNARISDPTYHVDDAFLRNEWNSYSYEFVAYVDCFCADLSGDPDFQYHLARAKFVSPAILSLALPFTTAQIFTVWPYYGDKYAPGLQFTSMEVRDHRAILRVEFDEQVTHQIEPYRRSCAHYLCQAVKGALSATPEKVHGLRAATVVDRHCMANGDAYCEYDVSWEPRRQWPWRSIAAGLGAGLAVALTLHLSALQVGWIMAMALAVPFGMLPWLTIRTVKLQQDVANAQRVIAEQVASVDTRHEELRNAYLTQQQATAVLRQKVSQLTLLHQTGLLVNSTLDREQLIQSILHHVKYDLNYDRVMLTFYDRTRQLGHDSRILGVSEEIAAFVRTIVTSTADPATIEGRLVHEGRPLLVPDIRDVLHELDPAHRELAHATNARSVLMVPLKVQSRVLGSLTVTRCSLQPLTADDQELMQTVAGQVAMALDNAEAYGQIEQLNVSLEAKVSERTTELARANERLQEMDRLKSRFVAHVSHELRTPLTVISGFADNMLEGVTGALSDKQSQYLQRIKASGLRLTRMIANLLHRARLEDGKEALSPTTLHLRDAVEDTLDQLRSLALAKRQRIEVLDEAGTPLVWADTDSVLRILTNLIDNAIKYTPDGGTIRIAVEPDGPLRAAVTVSDTGDGIAPEDLPRLFDPFYRAQQPRGAGSQKGLGLGLSIVRQLVELNAGTVTVQSQPGQGTTFRVTFPICRATTTRQHPDVDRPHIVLVAPDPNLRHLLSDRLRAEGYAVTTARGDDGAQLDRAGADGVLVDLSHPTFDGLAWIAQYRAQDEVTPIVALVEQEGEVLDQQAVAAGAQAAVEKSAERRHFTEILRRWFRETVETG